MWGTFPALTINHSVCHLLTLHVMFVDIIPNLNLFYHDEFWGPLLFPPSLLHQRQGEMEFFPYRTPFPTMSPLITEKVNFPLYRLSDVKLFFV